MNELNGLRTIFENADILHSVTECPRREDFEFEHDFNEAYDKWYEDLNTWKVRKNGR